MSARARVPFDRTIRATANRISLKKNEQLRINCIDKAAEVFMHEGITLIAYRIEDRKRVPQSAVRIIGESEAHRNEITTQLSSHILLSHLESFPLAAITSAQHANIVHITYGTICIVPNDSGFQFEYIKLLIFL